MSGAIDASESADVDGLMAAAREGNATAAERLLDLHRDRLKTMVAFRIDPQLAQRVDPSDVVQDSLLVAHQRLRGYLNQRPIAFYPWLRRIALNRLIDLHRRHIQSQRRSAQREVPLRAQYDDPSALHLADQLISSGTAPLGRLAKEEAHRRVQLALGLLSESHREVLILRYLEQLSVREAAAVLDISESSFKSRQVRALNKLRILLENDSESQTR